MHLKSSRALEMPRQFIKALSSKWCDDNIQGYHRQEDYLFFLSKMGLGVCSVGVDELGVCSVGVDVDC